MSRRWRWWLGCFVLLTLLAGCTTQTLPVVQKDPRQAALLAINGQQVMATLRELASDQYQGRKAGSIGDRLTTTYITEKMRAAGLKPKGTKDQYLQSFETYVSMVKAPTALSLTGLPGGAKKELRYGLDFRPNQFSLSGIATGPVVFAGYGVISSELQIDNFRGADLRGKTVVMIDGAPPAMSNLSISVEAKAQWAKTYGAAGVLIGPDPRSVHEHVAWQQSLRRGMGSRPGPGIIPTFLVAPGVMSDLTAGLDIAALMNRMEKGSPPIPLNTKVNATITMERQEKGITNNLLGFVPGSDPQKQDKIIVVGAHYDHLGMNPDGEVNGGAHDNASGTAVVLELARVLAINPPPISVLFAAWGAEENGLIGSQFFLNNPTIPLDKVIGCINLDMVGLKTGELALHHNPKRDSNQLLAMAQKEIGSMQVSVQMQDYLTGSDGYHFDQKGIPTIWFGDVWNNTLLPQYHTPEDKPELVGDAQIASVAKLVCATIWDYAPSK